MASLSDLAGVYGPSGQEAGFRLADIERQQFDAETNAAVGKERLTRDFSQYALPDLLSSQAARGAYGGTATMRKRAQLGNQFGDQAGDIDLGLAQTKAMLASQALLAQTGVQLGQGGY